MESIWPSRIHSPRKLLKEDLQLKAEKKELLLQNRYQLAEQLDIQLERTCQLMKKLWTRVLSESSSLECVKRAAYQLVNQERILDQEFGKDAAITLHFSLLKYYKLKELLFCRKVATGRMLKAIIEKLKYDLNLNSNLDNLTVDTEIDSIETPVMISSDQKVVFKSERINSGFFDAISPSRGCC